MAKRDIRLTPSILDTRIRIAVQMTESDPAVHCRFKDAVDLPAGLEAAHMEYLDVDAERAIVIYQSAILMVTASGGDVSAASAFDVELWEPPLHGQDRGANEMLNEFVAEFTTALPTTRPEE